MDVTKSDTAYRNVVQALRAATAIGYMVSRRIIRSSCGLSYFVRAPALPWYEVQALAGK